MIKKYNEIFGEDSKGILEIDSGKPGKTFALVGNTHGNEKVGIETMYYLINDFNIKNKLKSGKIIFVIGNIEAMKINKRLVDVDFNRVWGFHEDEKNTYEYKRAKELTTVLEKADYLIDLHSTSCPSTPMAIPVNNSVDKNLIPRLNIDYILPNILKFLHGKALVSYFYEKNPNMESLAIETGSHNSIETVTLAIDDIVHMLSFYNFIDSDKKREVKNSPKNIAVKEVIIAKTMDTKILYTDKAKGFDFVKKGTDIFFDGDEVITAEFDSYILIPTNTPTYIGEEMMYLGIASNEDL